jgi:hypothetical protein
MATIEQVRAELESELLQLKGVTGVGIGRDAKGEKCLVIYTTRDEDAPIDTLKAMLAETPWRLQAIGEVSTEEQNG